MGDESTTVRFVATGARGWENEVIIDAAIRKLIGQYGMGRLLLVADGGPGVGLIAEKRAENLGVHVARIHPLFHVWNHMAPVYGNAMMLDLLRPEAGDFVVAFHWALKTDSKNTRNCVIQAKRRNLRVIYVKTDRLKAVPSAARYMEGQARKRAGKARKRRT